MPAFMKYGSIKKGESLAEGHKGSDGWMEIGSISFGSSRTISIPSAGKREASAPSLGDLTITKWVDSTSPMLFKESLIGKPETVEIHLTTTGWLKLETYVFVSLKSALISNYLISSDGGRPVESVSINYKEIDFTYQGYDDEGKLDNDKKQTAIFDSGSVAAK